jgi:pyrroloquinoline quinone biosynthesis protein B
MIIRVLGSAAGGGFPQWNCSCYNCRAVRAGQSTLVARTQTSIAVSGDGKSWALFDAAPDLRAQICASPELQPKQQDPSRSSPIKAVVLTGFEIDQIGGLLNLREGQRFNLYATSFVLSALNANRIFDVLAPASVVRHEMEPGRSFEPFAGAGLEITPISVTGKVPCHHGGGDKHATRGDENVGLIIRGTANCKRIAYIPCCASVTDELLRSLDGLDVLLFDGTLYSERELIEQGLSHKTGSAMGHISMGGIGGSVQGLSGLNIGRRTYIHLNNSNPVLQDNSPERHLVTAAGWEVAYDGMEMMV